MKAVRTFILLLAAVLAMALPFPVRTAAAPNGHANVYVDAARPDDLGNGLSWATALKTINAGIAMVNEDGTVHVAAGIYNGTVLLDKACTLSGAGALSTFIDGGGTVQVVCVSGDDYHDFTISGFTIQNGYVGGTQLPGLGGGGMPLGGGVYVPPLHLLTMNDCAIVNNSSVFMGGGIYSAGIMYLNRCTVSGNSAGMIGGGIANYSHEGNVGTMELANCTISGNTVAGTSYLTQPQQGGSESEPTEALPVYPWLGGGIFNGGDATYYNVTIAGNSVPAIANSYGGGIGNVPLQCTNPNAPPVGDPVKNRGTYKNTIVAGNTPDNCYNDAETTVYSFGNNIDSQNNCGFTGQYDQVNTDPLLGSLKNNGGPTSTMAICENSPAYGRGSNEIYDPPFVLLPRGGIVILTTDQRGVARPQGAAWDIGAFEMVTLSVSTLAGSAAVDRTATFGGSLAAVAGVAPIYVYFEYGSVPGVYTGRTAQQLMTVAGQFSASVSGLPVGVCYYRAVAAGDCVFYGAMMSVVVPVQQVIDSSSAGGGAFGGGNSGNNNNNNNPPGWVGTGAPVAIPGITVASASLSAVSAAPGAPVTVNATVANKGTSSGTAGIKLYVNGREEASRGVSVASGASVPVSFTVSRDEPGTYTVSVGGKAAGSFTVEDVAGPDILLYASIGLIIIALAAMAVLLRRRAPVTR